MKKSTAKPAKSKSVKKDKPTINNPKSAITSIEWQEKEVRVADLTPYERNPRRISKEAYAMLVKSLKENGYHQRILATQDLRIIGGHQRIMALKECGYKSIKVLVPDRKISEEDYRRLLIQDNLPFGEFDFDILSADYEAQQLIEWGMPAEWLPNFDPASEEEQGKLGEKSSGDDPVKCPECGFEFDPNESKD